MMKEDMNKLSSTMTKF